MSGGIDMMRSTPINALRRDETQDSQTRDMVDGIVNELEYQGQGGLPGGNGGYPGGDQYEQMMDYGVSPEGGGYPHEFGGSNGFAPGDPRNNQQFPGDGQYPQYGQGMPQHMQMPPNDQHMQMQMPQGPPRQEYPSQNGGSSGFIGGLTDIFAANSKEPLLAAALYLVMTNDTVSYMISKYIPYASSPMLGLLIRAVLVAALFFVVKMFVLKR